MPKTYRDIQDMARLIGRDAYALVRRGIAGQPNTFYAVEGGHVVGTPFKHSISPELAQLMVRFGSARLVMWGEAAALAEVAHGTT